MDGPFLNQEGYEVPDNTIIVVPFDTNGDGFYTETLLPLKGNAKRDWFNSHFYYCLPLTVGNQYGFYVPSMRDFDITWDGTSGITNDVSITFLNEDNAKKQLITSGFGSGVVTVQNMFALKTPKNINLMTVQPPNMFLPACVALTGVIETDNIRRDFTFNFKVTVPNLKIEIRKGDPLGAFIPIQRGFVENFTVGHIDSYFPKELHINERSESDRLGVERDTVDRQKPHSSGRRYFKGLHTDGTEYVNHQKGSL
jgi:hypothetical protein